MIYFVGVIVGIVLAALVALVPFYLFLFIGETALNILNVGRAPKYLLIMLRSLRRNLMRTSLTYLAIFVLVVVVTLVWSILTFLHNITAEKSRDLKVIVTEKHQAQSLMPFAYANSIGQEALSLPEHLRPTEDDLMTWQFYGGTLDLEKRTRENLIFFFALEPRKLRTMMDDLEDLDPQLVRKLEYNMKGAIVGRERLKAMNKRVGEKMKVFSINYTGIDLEFEIVGEFPEGRYNQSAAMNRDYLNRALDDYEKKNKQKHPMADKSLALFWIRLPNKEAFELLAERVSQPGKFSNPPVKCDTASSLAGSWLESYKSMIWGMRWLLSPAILVTMVLVVSNAISIGVRERMTEMAVLKVLGFRPWQILTLILGEAILIGALSGTISAGGMYLVVDHFMGGIKFPIAFFPSFFVPSAALWWGPVMGGGTAFLGSVIPAWSAQTVRVSEVFSRVA